MKSKKITKTKLRRTRNIKKKKNNKKLRKQKGGNEKIPKIVHQIWIGDKKRPDVWMDTIKAFCNDFGYEYKLWDNTAIENLNMINKKYYNIEKTYNGKSDILRYEILYQYGGVYIDADMVILNGEKLNNIINELTNDIALGWEKDNELIASSVIFSVKNGKFIKDCIDMVKNRNLAEDAWISIGPQLITDIYNSNTYDIKLFPSKLFYPVDWHGITSINAHTKGDYPDSVMFQYGYTTNQLGTLI